MIDEPSDPSQPTKSLGVNRLKQLAAWAEAYTIEVGMTEEEGEEKKAQKVVGIIDETNKCGEARQD